MDCGYAILVEEYQRLGVDLLTAVERLGDFAGGSKKTDGRTAEAEPPAPSERSVVSQNQASMAQLEKMMAGAR